jgi:hypothetical protein
MGFQFYATDPREAAALLAWLQDKEALRLPTAVAAASIIKRLTETVAAVAERNVVP